MIVDRTPAYTPPTVDPPRLPRDLAFRALCAAAGLGLLWVFFDALFTFF